MAGKTFEKAPKVVTERLARVLKKYHSRLTPPMDPDKPNGDAYPIQIEAILAYAKRDKWGVITGDGITVRGRAALACVRITKLEERVAGRGDAIIWIDGDKYKAWSPVHFDAILDHELTHLELTDDVFPEYDDAGRLRLRIRPHDFEVGWFAEVAERHGEHSAEAVQAATLVGQQYYFPGFEFVAASGKRSA
jgi:hypothetical protein